MDRFRIVYKWNSIRVWYDRKSKNALFEKLFKVVMKLLLVIDVGNTNTVLGVYHNGELNYHWRIETSRHKTEDEFGMSIRALFDYVGLMFDQIEGIIISSVVPPMMFALERMCEKYFHLTPQIVEHWNEDWIKHYV